MIHCTVIPDVKRVEQFRWVGPALTGNDPKPEETPVRIPPDQPEAPPVEKPVERPGEMPTPEIPPIEKPREIPPEAPEIMPPSDQAASPVKIEFLPRFGCFDEERWTMRAFSIYHQTDAESKERRRYETESDRPQCVGPFSAGI
jgi:hypothetical protein